MALSAHGVAVAADPIRIGLLTVDGGSFSFIQPFFSDPARLAVDDINEAAVHFSEGIHCIALVASLAHRPSSVYWHSTGPCLTRNT